MFNKVHKKKKNVQLKCLEVCLVGGGGVMAVEY